MNGKPGRDGPLGAPGNGYCPTLPNVPNYKSFLNHKPITPPAPTYRDIIKEAKRQLAKNQKDFRIEKHRINEEIKLLRQRQERIDKELDRLQAKATKKPYEAKNDFDKFLHKLRSEAQTEREFLASLSSSTSSTEDYNCKEEECQEKPEMDCI